MSGATTYPKANRTIQWWGGKFFGSSMRPNVLVLHSAETTGWPGYNDGASAPHLTARPNFATESIDWRQHFPLDKSSRALVNKLGGVETNTLHVIQVELVGTCDPATKARWERSGLVQDVDFIFMPEPPVWFVAELAEFVAWSHNEYPDLPIADGAPRGWLPYPSSYGDKSGQRMTFAEWNAGRGIVGHQHPPENDHGDPGDFPIDALVQLALVYNGDHPSDPQATPSWFDRVVAAVVAALSKTPTPAPTPVPKPPLELASFTGSDFGPGKKGPQVLRLGQQLVAWGFGSRYAVGPSEAWGPVDGLNTSDLQKSLGFTGSDADGIPGSTTLPFLDGTPTPVTDCVVVTGNLAGTTMSPKNTEGSAYWVKGRTITDRIPDIAKRVLGADADVFATTESGDKAAVDALSTELSRRSGVQWDYATGAETESLRLALHWRTDTFDYVTHEIVKTPGPNHNLTLRTTLRDRDTGFNRVFTVVHYYHHSGPTNDTLRGQQAAASRGDVVLGDLNSAIGDNNDKTEKALRTNELIDAERLAIKTSNSSVNTAPGGKVRGRQIDRIAVALGTVVLEWGVLIDNDQIPDTDHPGFVYSHIKLRTIN